ncbi:Membrane alanine aminopeptidase N [Enterobacter cancerogenus]|uniref:Membrane alanine aminopeptidase N n=1 Tax=Enterobacter cancerogenus TaxID=69218 RepID=A0A484XBT1_9ENTR|nr:Membrane alanine aminopeptidase N [Enterobacter cancerogenus]
MTQQPQAKYRHDYRAPEYLISDIDLTFDLDATKTVCNGGKPGDASERDGRPAAS